MGFDWLSGQVAMVKAVIKAIKAAGVGLNGSSDCCCHTLNRKGERESLEEWESHEKMELQEKECTEKKTEKKKQTQV